MRTKRKLTCVTIATLAIVATTFLSRSPEEVVMKYQPTLVERTDESFKMVGFKVTRQSELSFACDGSLRCRMKLYSDRILSGLGLRKPRYRLGGTSDFIWITYRSEKLTQRSLAQPFFQDDRGKTVFPNTYNSTYDARTGDGVLAVPLPDSLTNGGGWKLHLNIPPDGKGFLGGEYAVYKF